MLLLSQIKATISHSRPDGSRQQFPPPARLRCDKNVDHKGSFLGLGGEVNPQNSSPGLVGHRAQSDSSATHGTGEENQRGKYPRNCLSGHWRSSKLFLWKPV